MKKIINKIGFILFGLFFSAVSVFGEDIDEVTNIIDKTSTAGKQVYGTGITWFVAVIFPLISMVSLAIIAYTMAKKKVEQTQDGQSKIPVYVILGVIVGAFVYVIITALIFQLLTGDAGNAATVINNFYKEALGL
ncbi:hypothetical protein ACLKHP_001691 [Campylobacter jejuni]